MYEPLDSFLNLDVGTVRHEVRDLAAESLADREALFDAIPRIGLKLLETQRDPFLVLVDLQNDNREAVARFDGLTWVSETGPGHIGDMEKTIDSI